MKVRKNVKKMVKKFFIAIVKEKPLKVTYMDNIKNNKKNPTFICTFTN